ncbi:MAG: ABC transporter permease [Thermoplasmata archaeon]
MAGLLKYWVMRSIQSFVTFIIIVISLFFLLHVLPVNFGTLLSLNPQLTPSQKEFVVRLYGLNQPLWVQFENYLMQVFTFNYGYSFVYGVPVSNLLAQTVPRTLFLFGLATIISYIIGYFVGAIIAWRRGGILDASNVVIGLFFYNMPTYWVGMIFIFIFSFELKLFPLGGFFDATDKIFGWNAPNNIFWVALDYLWHAALPLIVLVLIFFAGNVLLMRTSMLDVIGENYIDVAIAKGLTEKEVLFKHAARNALLPLVTSFIISMAFAIGGGVLTETVFSYFGVGLLYIKALNSLDYPVIEATVIIISLLVIIFNWIADIIYGYLDPRVRVE